VSGQDSKSKKDNSAVASETWTDASIKRRKGVSADGGRKKVATPPPFVNTTCE